MESISWITPILPGKLEAWKAFHAEINGERREEHRASRQRMGVTREVASLVHTPQGDIVAMFHEGETLKKGFQTIAASTDPYDLWFRDKLVELHGLTAEMLAGPTPAQVFLDYHDEVLERQLAPSRGASAGSDTD